MAKRRQPAETELEKPKHALPRLSVHRATMATAMLPKHDFETVSGAPDSAPRCPRVKLASRGIERLKPPDWFLKLVKDGQPPEKVAEALRKRVAAGENLHTTKLIVNEIGRLPGGSRLIREGLTQEIVFKLQQPRKKDEPKRKERRHARR